MHTTPKLFRRRGLTFIELMFATIILGVGMIIIAAAFPVAINEQRITIDEATVASIERGAIRTLDATAQRIAPPTADNPAMPDTLADEVNVVRKVGDPPLKEIVGEVESMDFMTGGGGGWSRIRGDLVCPSNERYAWTPLYMRPALLPAGTHQPKVTFFVTSLIARDSATFLGENLDPASQVKELNKLKPTRVKITYHFKEDPDSGDFVVAPEQDTIKIEQYPGSPDVLEIRAAVEGAFVIRGQNVNTNSVLFPQNAIIKLGTQFEPSELSPSANNDARYFRVAPGAELLNDDVRMKDAAGTAMLPDAVNGVKAWVVGRYVELATGEPNKEPANESDLKVGRSNRAISCRGITVEVKDPG